MESGVNKVNMQHTGHVKNISIHVMLTDCRWCSREWSCAMNKNLETLSSSAKRVHVFTLNAHIFVCVCLC